MSKRAALGLSSAASAALIACGSATTPAARAPLPSPAATAAAAARPAPPPDPLPTLDDLASRAGELAGGMREAVRRESSVDDAPAEAIRAVDKDECVRVLFVSDVPLRARLLDSAGDALASLDAPASAAALAAAGPVCVRRGDAVKVAFARDAAASSAARVRWVAWASP